MQMPTLTEPTKLDKFVHGFRPTTCIEVELRDPQTTNEAYRLADRFDRIVYGHVQDTFLLSTMTNSHASNSPWADTRGEPMQINSLQRRQTRSIAISAGWQPTPRRNNDKSDAEAQAKGLCYNCHKPSHIARECPDKFPSNNDRSFNNAVRAPPNGHPAPRRFPNSGNGRPRS
jgi:hypothetical protein